MNAIVSITKKGWKALRTKASGHGKALGLAFMGCMALASFAATGDASALVDPNSTDPTSFYGLSVIDWILEIAGLITLVAGIFMRDFRALILAVILMVLGAVAFYLGL